MDLNILNRAAEMFRVLGWSTETEEGTQIFERFCRVLALLTTPEQELLLTITHDFMRIPLARYDPLLLAAMEKLGKHFVDGSEVLSGPLIKPEDEGSTKSGSMAAYLFRAYLPRVAGQARLRHDNFDRLTLLAQEAKARHDPLIVLLDDFVGGGGTAKGCLDYLEAEGISLSKVFIVTVAAQKRAVDLVQARGVPCISGVLRMRGISDSKRLSDIPAAHAVMDSLEARIGIAERYRRGRAAAEALICLLRCPNNTFPVYWTNKKVDGLEWPAPFVR